MEFYLVEKFMEKFLLLSHHDTEQRFSYEEFRQGSVEGIKVYQKDGRSIGKAWQRERGETPETLCR